MSTFTDFIGTDPVAYVLSANIHRRHMLKGAMAMALAMIAPEAEKGAPGKRSKILLCFEGDERNAMRVAINKALAIQVYSRQAQNIEAETRAVQIRLRAERKAGELLRDKEKAKRGPDKDGSGQRSQRATSETRTLRELGISKDQSSQWQKLAAVPDEEFEAAAPIRSATSSTPTSIAGT